MVIALFALPLFYACYRLGWRRWWQFVAAGLVALFLFRVYNSIETQQVGHLFDGLEHWTLRFWIHAIAASLIFWFVAVWRRAPNERAVTIIQ